MGARRSLEDTLTTLIAQVFVECYSVLTRLPAPHRFSADLVAVTARHRDLQLLTRDRRARTTYDALGVAYTLV